MNKKVMITLSTLLCTSMFFMLSTQVNNAQRQVSAYTGNPIEEFEAMRSSVMVNEQMELNPNFTEFDLENCEECGIGEMEEAAITAVSSTTTSAVTTTSKPTTTKPQTTTVITTTQPPQTTLPPVTTTPITTTPSTSETQPTEGTTPAPAPSPSPVTEMAREIFEIVNQKREAAGLKGYELDEQLCEIANMRARELTSKFSHTRPSGKDFSTALKEYEYSYRLASENIAYGYSSASAVMNQWMSSAPHKGNILDGKKLGYTKIGIGYYNNNGTKYYVQLFVK